MAYWRPRLPLTFGRKITQLHATPGENQSSDTSKQSKQSEQSSSASSHPTKQDIWETLHHHPASVEKHRGPGTRGHETLASGGGLTRKHASNQKKHLYCIIYLYRYNV